MELVRFSAPRTREPRGVVDSTREVKSCAERGLRRVKSPESETLRRTIAEKLLLIEATNDDKGSCSSVLVFPGFPLRALFSPLTLYDLKGGFESVDEQSLHQAVIDAIMQLNLPDGRKGCEQVGY